MNSHSLLKSLIVSSVVLLGLTTTSISHGQAIYEVAGPFTPTGALALDNQGTFTVSLELDVSQEDLNCFFFAGANIVLPVTGEGFTISNFESTDPTDAVLPVDIGSGILLTWLRQFPGVDSMETEITGVLFSFDIAFDEDFDGVASYTIGETGPTGSFDVMCTDDDGFPVGGDPGGFAGVTTSDFFDNLGGVTFFSFILGDVNGDGVADLLDVAGFVDLILNGGFNPAADINQDGVVDLLDVAGFVALLLG